MARQVSRRCVSPFCPRLATPSTQHDKVLDTLDSDAAGPAFRKCLRELGRVCGARNRLPQSYILESSLSIPNKYPVASGGSGDVYEGSLNGSKVCVKRLRIYAGDESPGAKKVH